MLPVFFPSGYCTATSSPQLMVPLFFCCCLPLVMSLLFSHPCTLVAAAFDLHCHDAVGTAQPLLPVQHSCGSTGWLLLIMSFVVCHLLLVACCLLPSTCCLQLFLVSYCFFVVCPFIVIACVVGETTWFHIPTSVSYHTIWLAGFGIPDTVYFGWNCGADQAFQVALVLI